MTTDSARLSIILPESLELVMVYSGFVPLGTAEVVQIPSMACFAIPHEAWEDSGRDMRKLMRDEKFRNVKAFDGIIRLKKAYVLVMKVSHEVRRPWVSIQTAFFSDLWSLSSAFRLAEVHGS